MTLTVPELTRIAETVARDEAPGIGILSVASSSAESRRAELLVTITGCHTEPCALLLNLNRRDPVTFEQDFRYQLRTAMRAHLQDN